jgi:hypothetical protein
VHDDLPFGDTLRARRADVVLTEDVDQVAAHHAGVEGCKPRRQDDPGHEQRREPAPGILGEGRVAPRAREERDQPDVVREEEQCEQTEPVDRRRDRDQGAAHRGAVDDRAPAERRDDPDGDRDEDPDDERAEGERDRDGKPGEELRPNRDLVLVRVAEVEVERQPFDEAPVLDVDGLVEPE